MSISIPDPPTSTGLLSSGFAAPPGAYDEMFSAPGVLRPHWQHFGKLLEAMGPREVGRLWDQARRMLHESGVTYNAYGDPVGADRPWELDAIPLVISAAEWGTLATGLSQRARLLEEIIADLYGPQRLLAEGILPAEFVYSHPGFLRPCHGLPIHGGVYLQLYGADLVRSSNGQWWIQADRTQTPSGAGYAVENRIVISRMLPGVFRDCQVERLAPFFMALRETLPSLAPRRSDNPRIVLLSAGPSHETYFEDAYLARYMGYTLVEGGDLAVRDDVVYLKTLGGLLPVDVIMRRLAEEHCDPLELRADSMLGVPGLLGALRAGNVAVTNAFGTGLVETPAITPFLPALCRRLLAEELKLPSVATWWCGQKPALQYVIDHLHELVIAPAFRRSGMVPVAGGTLSAKERAQWIARIKSRPHDFVGREAVTLSTAPVWDGSGMVPRHLALRTYATAQDGDYLVMNGGLARMSATPAPLSAALAAGRGSKDTWILSVGPVQPVSLLHPAGQPVPLRRSGNELPSRVADNLFWLGRQAERAEGAARVLRGILSRLTSELDAGAMPELPILLEVLAELGDFRPGTKRNSQPTWPAVERELKAFVFDATRPSSVRATLNNLHRLASIVRDRISIDAWRVLNTVEQDFMAPANLAGVQLADVLSMLNQMVVNLMAFSGLATESMTRTQGWRFLDMGRRLERSMHTIALLRTALVPVLAHEGPVLEAVLETADSAMTYRARYLSTLQIAPVVDLLLTDETNPRSLVYQLGALATHVENLPRDLSNPNRTQEQRIVLSLTSSIRLAEIDALCLEQDGARKPLDALLVKLTDLLPKLSDSLARHYLIHAGPSRQLGEIRTEPTGDAPT